MKNNRPDISALQIAMALPSDALAMSKIHKAAWQAAYRGLLPEDYLSAIADDRWVGSFEKVLNENTTQAWLLKVKGQTVACAFAGPSRYGGYEGSLELISIYCLPEYWGTGMGSRLFQCVLDYATKNQYIQIGLWVLEGNERAIAFYERLGFQADGATMPMTIGGKPVLERRYLLDVD